MSDKALVSIGMPSYNGERYIRKALDSLLAQDYESFEIIISDNASTDATLQICTDYAARDSRISVHTHPCNVGALANFKTVLEMAKGKYFMWAAVDDYWLPNFVDVMVKELETHPEAGVAMCAVNRVSEDGTYYDTVRFTGALDPNTKSYYQMLMGIMSPKKHKYNLFIYGLFRTSLLQKAVLSLPEVPRVDRLLMGQMALAAHFRWVDHVLHVRTVHNQPTHVQLSDEEFNKIWDEDKCVLWKSIVATGQMLWRSTIIPMHRKIYIPAAILSFSLLHIRLKLRS